jgi:hypothetical protein
MQTLCKIRFLGCPSHLFCYPRLQVVGKASPMGDTFPPIFHQKMILLEIVVSTLLHVACMQIETRDNSLSSIDFDFQLPLDFGFDVLFPRNFSVLHRIHVDKNWLALTMHESPFMEVKSIRSSSDTCVSMLHLSFWPRSASAL